MTSSFDVDKMLAKAKEAENRIKSFYDKPDYTIIGTYKGEAAWKRIVEFKYTDGMLRTHFRRPRKNLDKSNAFLVVFIVSDGDERISIGADYYLDKFSEEANPENDEDGDNIFDAMEYRHLNHPAAPKFVQKLV